MLTTFYSCATVKLAGRQDKDLVLNSDNFMTLNGIYANNSNDTSKTFWSNFDSATIYKYNQYTVSITPNDLNTLKIKLNYEDSVVSVNMLGGHYKKGYFVVEREWTTDFIAGPLLWFLNNNLRYIGITKKNDLVILDSGGKLLVFLMMVPITSKKIQYESEFKRIKK
ncbi:MAG: hypothetical protein SGJ10_00140 [Bacteroidota bacterium]|nr:hypothetical protein [Bacteroidota bacterium]